MFDLAVIGTDAFNDMPHDAQNLYFQLGMRADDEGFISPRGVIKMISASDDAIKILIAKNFVIPFESGVVVITDWKRNNFLDSRRIQQTLFQEEQKSIVEINRKYILNTRLASAKPMLSEDRIGQDRIGQDILPAEVPQEKKFSLKEEIQKLENNTRRDLNIIALYLDERQPNILTYAQFTETLKRHLRASKSLIPFTDEQILNAIPSAKKLSDGWTLDTILKVLTK